MEGAEEYGTWRSQQEVIETFSIVYPTGIRKRSFLFEA
jgi:hypothetical protein